MNATSVNFEVRCPLCKSRLSYGTVGSILHTKVVDPITGQLQKRIKKIKIENTDLRSYLICENTGCEFIIDNEDEACAVEHMQLFEQINNKDADDFAKQVKSNN